MRQYQIMKDILSQALKNWLRDDPFTQSAAAAYYAIFSMPGLLIIIMALAVIFFDQQKVQTEVLNHIRDVLGSQTAGSVQHIVEQAQKNDRDLWAMIAGGVTLLFGATGLFAQLQRSLNRIWEVEFKKTAGIKAFIKSRLISFGLILVVGFLLLISLSLTTVLTVFGEWTAEQFSPKSAIVLALLNVGLSFLTITALFMMIFKILPDAKVAWRVAFLGGALSALLFTVGQYALNYYFDLAKPQSSFGAAGSAILVMLWVSYSCMILMIGAEFSRTYAEAINGGRKAKPKPLAKKKIRKG